MPSVLFRIKLAAKHNLSLLCPPKVQNEHSWLAGSPPHGNSGTQALPSLACSHRRERAWKSACGGYFFSLLLFKSTPAAYGGQGSTSLSFIHSAGISWAPPASGGVERAVWSFNSKTRCCTWPKNPLPGEMPKKPVGILAWPLASWMTSASFSTFLSQNVFSKGGGLNEMMERVPSTEPGTS